MQLATVFDLMLKSIIFIRKNVCLLAEIVHELEFDFFGFEESLGEHFGVLLFRLLRVAVTHLVRLTDCLFRVLLTNGGFDNSRIVISRH